MMKSTFILFVASAFVSTFAHAQTDVYGSNVTFRNLAKPKPVKEMQLKTVSGSVEEKARNNAIQVVKVPKEFPAAVVNPGRKTEVATLIQDSLPVYKLEEKVIEAPEVNQTPKAKVVNAIPKQHKPEILEVPKAPTVAEMLNEPKQDNYNIESVEDYELANAKPLVTPVEIAKSEKPRTIADYKNQRLAIELVKRFFYNYGGFKVLSAPGEISRKKAFIDQEPKTLPQAAKLLEVPLSHFYIDRFTKTVVISPDFRKVSITDPLVESEYGSPLKMRFGVVHNPSVGSKGNIDTNSQYLDGTPFVKEIPTPYGTLIEIHGDQVVNNSFTIEAAFAIENGNNAFRELFIQPINPNRVGESHAK